MTGREKCSDPKHILKVETSALAELDVISVLNSQR